ncbi:DUF1330 domain-containing protein [Tunturiibacter lichenicola]|uniref:DUF1330 domain-containing protein n=1 Tax=Tunturiibacter lichenicola TaxID=2051959 RepID=UPI0021B178E8|nr:DUF1330 domain-containing protein [Edaphobacter lichenicola]
MPAYIVFTREKTRNQVEYDEYKSSVRATLVGHSAKLLALGGNYEVLEGAATEGVFLMEFPSYDEAAAWYSSPAYRALSVHRWESSDHRCVIFEGV